MASKKVKRARMQAKRAEFEEEIRLSGLAAQKKDRAARYRELLKSWQKQHDEKHNWKNRPQECPHCQIILKAAKSKTEPQTVS